MLVVGRSQDFFPTERNPTQGSGLCGKGGRWFEVCHTAGQVHEQEGLGLRRERRWRWE